MAKVKNNVFLNGAKGMIGEQMVVRQTKHGTVIGVRPEYVEAALTDPQKAWRNKFRIAVAYAKGAQGRDEYKELAESRELSAFNVATADFLHPPEIAELDISGYHGKPGDPIWMRVVDDVAVATVGILITNEQNVVIEQGHPTKDPQDPTRWNYVATAQATGTHVKIIIDAADLPGHITKSTTDVSL